MLILLKLLESVTVGLAHFPWDASAGIHVCTSMPLVK